MGRLHIKRRNRKLLEEQYEKQKAAEQIEAELSMLAEEKVEEVKAELKLESKQKEETITVLKNKTLTKTRKNVKKET